MRLHLFIFIFVVFLQCLYADKNQNTDFIEESTTKKSGGFFGSVKSFFRGSTTTSTTVAPVLSEKNQIQAPLQPLGPRPETPDSSSATQKAFEWPAISNNGASSFSKQSNLPPGFGSYSSNKKQQPSGIELSYGNQASVDTAGQDSKKSTHQKPSASDSTSTITDRSLDTSSLKIDMRSAADSPTTPKSPSAWDKPLRFDNIATTPKPTASPASKTTALPSTTAASTHSNKVEGTNGVSFVNTKSDSATTARTVVESQTSSYASDDEIRALTEELYQKEVHSTLPLIKIQLQGKTRSIDSTDEAPQPLLVVNEKAFEVPAITKMKNLFNNYDSDTLVNEHVTALEKNEENEFVDSLMSTNVMRHTMQFLQKRGFVTADVKTHRDLVKELWFTQYSRGQGKIGSSGFEHVFVNEVKNGTIIGLHNWVYFNEEEKAGRLDYRGYIKALDLGTKAKVAKVRFTHNGMNKPVNTLFIGTSPELEVALYTLCFQLRPDRTCPVSLGNSKFGIITYSWRYRGKNLIGSAYPEI